VATDFKFRKKQVKTLSTSPGVYVLCDLDNVPMYVGKSSNGIRARVNRHLTSARSDIIANRQIDIWEIAYVHTYPEADPEKRKKLETKLFHNFNAKSPLVNGDAFPKGRGGRAPKAFQEIQVMSDEEIGLKKDPVQRLPRQAEHYAQIVNHFLTIKNSPQISRAIAAHFQRLERYHNKLLGLVDPREEPEENT